MSDFLIKSEKMAECSQNLSRMRYQSSTQKQSSPLLSTGSENIILAPHYEGGDGPWMPKIAFL